VILLAPQRARLGRAVRVKEGCGKTDLVGLRGTVQQCWGHPDFPAVDDLLEDGRTELLWFHELEVVEKGDVPSHTNLPPRR
jgi:hypothetical protein